MLYLIAFLFLIFILGFVVFPVETESLRAAQRPCLNYEEGMRRIGEKIAADPPNIADHGHAIIKTHGHKTERAIVLYHGYTNCPRQYEQLVERFFTRGYNVYVPRVPHHGIGDRHSSEIRQMTIAKIMEVCDTSVDIARGLGEKVSVLGLSMGGVMAAWNAQFRDDIDVAAVLVPSFGWYYLPGVVKPIINLSFLFPDMLLWWDPVQREKRDCPFSMYHRFSSHGMAHIWRLGLAVLRAAKRKAPLSSRIVIMTNDIDIAVDERNVRDLAKSWWRLGADVEWYHFPKDLKMEHDIIDPLHPYACVDLVYDKILSMLE